MTGKIKRINVFIMMLTIVFISAAGYAQETAGQLSDPEVIERINHIQGVLDSGQDAARYWFYGWTIGYSALTAGQFAVYFTTDEEETKQDMLVGGVQSALGVVGMFIDPMVPAYAPDELRSLPGNTPLERRNKLDNAEKFLKRSAQREIDGRSWLTHALAFVVNAGGGLVIWLHYDRPFLDGFINFAIGTAVSEVQIYTQPMRAVDDWDDYKKKYSIARDRYKDSYRREWFLVAYPGGLGVGLKF